MREGIVLTLIRVLLREIDLLVVYRSFESCISIANNENLNGFVIVETINNIQNDLRNIIIL